MINPSNYECVAICGNGFYPDEDNICQPCSGKCEECISATLCTACKDETIFTSEEYWPYIDALIHYCVCDEGYYESFTGTGTAATTANGNCLECPQECATCAWTRSCENEDNCQEATCTSCHDFARLEGTQCVCITGYVLDATDGYCYVDLGRCGSGRFEDDDGTC